MSDEPVTGNQNVPELPALEGKNFQEKVQLLTQYAYELMARNVPELDGVAFVLMWNAGIRGTKGLDYGRIWGRNPDAPRFRLHALEQTQRMLTWQAMEFHKQLLQADQIAQQLDSELHAKRQELKQLEEAIEDLRASGCDPTDTPGPT